MFARALVPTVAVLALAASGCGKSVAISSWQAPEADIGGARRLVLTDAYGRSDSVAAITDFAVEQAQQATWFEDVRVSFDRLETDGRSAWLGRDDNLDGGTLYVRLDVLEDSAVVSQQEHVVTDDQGREGVVIEDHLFAHTLLALTVANRRGVVVLEREVEGVHEQVGVISDYDVEAGMEAAGRAAAAGALALVTPLPLTVQVPLDDRDEAVLALTEDALAGNASAKASLEGNDATAAVYNLAVVTEDAGDLDGAVDLYEEAAARRDAAGFYGSSLAGARERQQSLRDLGL